MYQVGIDIGSSAAKTAVIKDGEVVKTYLFKYRLQQQKNGGGDLPDAGEGRDPQG